MSESNSNIKALRKLIKERGGQVKLAEELTKEGYPITQSAIALWIRRKTISRQFAIHIEETYGEPTRYQLCPEYYRKKVKKISKASKKNGRRVGKHQHAV